MKEMSSLLYVLKYFSQLIICLLTFYGIFFSVQKKTIFYVVIFTNHFGIWVLCIA